MATKTPPETSGLETSAPSARTIARDLERAAKFLGALSRSPDIWRMMVQLAGYSQATHDEGWGRYLAVMGYQPPRDTPSPKPSAQGRAIAQLDAWDAPNFERASAALERAYPEQRATIFNGLSAATGPAAIGSVRTFLDRVSALRKGSAADKAAAQLLADRKILDAATEDQLEGWLGTAQQGSSPRDAPPSAITDETEYLALAAGLNQFLQDWRTQARNVITRRDYLIQLGLASYRRSTGPNDADDAPEPTV